MRPTSQCRCGVFGGGAVLVDPRTKTGWAELEGHCLPRPKSHRSHIATLQVFDLDHAVRILALDEPSRLHRVVLAVAISARRAVYSNFELSAYHCGWSCGRDVALKCW